MSEGRGKPNSFIIIVGRFYLIFSPTEEVVCPLLTKIHWIPGKEKAPFCLISIHMSPTIPSPLLQPGVHVHRYVLNVLLLFLAGKDYIIMLGYMARFILLRVQANNQRSHQKQNTEYILWVVGTLLQSHLEYILSRQTLQIPRLTYMGIPMNL